MIILIHSRDCGNLDDTQLKALREFLPTKDERFAIDGYIKGASGSSKTKEAAINDLCACEKYMLAMMKVEMADEKFEAMLFKYQFDIKLKELMEKESKINQRETKITLICLQLIMMCWRSPCFH